MKIEKLMSRPVRACAPTDTLATAAHLMWEGDCGMVPVIDAAGRPVGVLTDRDVCMTALFEGTRLADTPIGRVMARRVVSVAADQTMHDALELMREHRVRRLPVVDAEGQLVGIVSLADLARLWEGGAAADERSLGADDVAQALAAVCGSRQAPPQEVLVVEITPHAQAERAAAEAARKEASAGGKTRSAKGSRSRSRSRKG